METHGTAFAGARQVDSCHATKKRKIQQERTFCAGIAMQRRLLLLMVIFCLTACGGGDNPPPTRTAHALAVISLVSGNNQVGPAGAQLPIQLTAEVQDASGQPIAGQVVNYVVTTGGGQVFAPAVTSDANGHVTNVFTLGTLAGVNAIEIRAINSLGIATVYATFNASAVAGPAYSVTPSSGDGQSAQQLQTLSSPNVVVVKDSYGNSVSGALVTFTAGDGGMATPASSTTDSNGLASTSWALGTTVGPQTLVAAVAGISPFSFTASSVRAPAGAPATVVKISGDSQTVVQHLALSQALQVQVTDALGNPVPGTQVTFTAAGGNSVFLPTTATADGNGLASWSGYLHTAGSQQVIVTAQGATSASFKINVTPSSHIYDGLYVCQSVSSTCPIQSFSIVSGAIPPFGNFSSSGQLDSSTGLITLSLQGGVGGLVTATGQLSVDINNQSIGTGTITNAYGALCSENVGSQWTCSRQ